MKARRKINGKRSASTYILLALAILSILLPVTQAYGSVAKSESATVYQGGTAKFTLLFWGNSEYVDVFVKNAPQGWNVFIDKQSVSTNSGSEYIYTGGVQKKAALVNVYVTPTANGVVTIGTRSRSGPGIAVAQERYFELSIAMIKGPAPSSSNPASGSASQQEAAANSNITYPSPIDSIAKAVKDVIFVPENDTTGTNAITGEATAAPKINLLNILLMILGALGLAIFYMYVKYRRYRSNVEKVHFQNM